MILNHFISKRCFVCAEITKAKSSSKTDCIVKFKCNDKICGISINCINV